VQRERREGVGYAQIRRTNRMRTVTVTGDVREGVIPEQVVEALAPALAAIVSDTPGLVVREGGRQKDLTDAFSTLPRAALTAFLLIYAILCWLFGSFVQPFAVMATIPFGVIGAVWGHAIMGYELTFLSLIGIVALSGVVVNNALVLVEFVNELRAKGMVLHDALIEAGTMRLRAILLTSITTVFGLAPLMLEQSFQARFLIPMAISLCFGLLSATISMLGIDVRGGTGTGATLGVTPIASGRCRFGRAGNSKLGGSGAAAYVLSDVTNGAGEAVGRAKRSGVVVGAADAKKSGVSAIGGMTTSGVHASTSASGLTTTAAGPPTSVDLGGVNPEFARAAVNIASSVASSPSDAAASCHPSLAGVAPAVWAVSAVGRGQSGYHRAASNVALPVWQKHQGHVCG
jgi:hypothetical protein